MAESKKDKSKPTPATPPPGPSSLAHADDRPRLVQWIDRNQRLVTWGLTAVAVVVVGAWLLRETGRRKATAAAAALDFAQSTMQQGNLPGAATEFQRIIRSYGGTDAAYQAELGANEVRLASGQTQIAVDELRKFVATDPPRFYAAGAWSMMAGALEDLKKFDEAAGAYRRASELAPEDFRKVDGLLGAARAYRLAGQASQSLEVYRQIIGSFSKETPGVAEAKVRLSEATQGRM